MEWTQTEKAAEKTVATQQAAAAPAPAQNQGGKKGDKKSVHISELSMQQLQNIGREFNLTFWTVTLFITPRPNATRVQSTPPINERPQGSWNELLWRTSSCPKLEGLVSRMLNLFCNQITIENLEMGDDKIFVPMTNSLLVPGKMAEGNMLVELGGGIMMEKSIGGDYFKVVTFSVY